MRDAPDVHRLVLRVAPRIVLVVVTNATRHVPEPAKAADKGAHLDVTVVQVVVGAHLNATGVAVAITLVIQVVLADARLGARAVLVVALHVLLDVTDALALMGQLVPLAARPALAQDALVQVELQVHPVGLLAIVKDAAAAQVVVLLIAQRVAARIAIQFALQVVRPLATMAALTLVKQHAQQRVPIPVLINVMAQAQEQYKFMNGGKTMLATFSNGFSMEVASAIESRNFSSESSLAFGINGAIDIDATVENIKGGLNTITVDNPALTFKGYTRLLSVQNIINEDSVEANIRLSRE